MLSGKAQEALAVCGELKDDPVFKQLHVILESRLKVFKKCVSEDTSEQGQAKAEYRALDDTQKRFLQNISEDEIHIIQELEGIAKQILASRAAPSLRVGGRVAAGGWPAGARLLRRARMRASRRWAPQIIGSPASLAHPAHAPCLTRQTYRRCAGSPCLAICMGDHRAMRGTLGA